MRKTLTAFLFLLFCNCCTAQLIPLRVSSLLTVSMPASPDSMSRNGVTIYSAITDSLSYQAGADSAVLKVSTEKDFQIALKGVYHGLASKLAAYAIQQSDTTIGGVNGLFAYAVSKDTSKAAMQVYMFYTVVSGHCHFVQCVTSLRKPALEGVRTFFNSARFEGKNYPAEDRVYSISYRIGEVLGMILTLGVIIFLLTVVVRWITKARK